jgi:hypothetical protein
MALIVWLFRCIAFPIRARRNRISLSSHIKKTSLQDVVSIIQQVSISFRIDNDHAAIFLLGSNFAPDEFCVRILFAIRSLATTTTERGTCY